MKNLIKLGVLSTALMLSFGSFAGPVSAVGCKLTDGKHGCNKGYLPSTNGGQDRVVAGAGLRIINRH
jgi:hypothetical protein